MNKYEEAVKQLQKGIETYVDKKISETKFDKTYIGIITAITDNNTYSVNVKNVVYNNVPVAGNAVCKLNEIVKVLVPMSNFNNMFIINVNNDYVNNINKPTINGVEIVGNLTQEDLHIETIDTISEFGGFIQSKGKYFNNNKNVGMSPNNDRYALWAGETNKKNGLIGESNAYFKLKQNGNLLLNSDKVDTVKGNLFAEFYPQKNNNIFDVYYYKVNKGQTEDEILVDLPKGDVPKIEYEDVHIETINEQGNLVTLFDPSAFFVNMSKGFISRMSKSLAEENKNNIYVQLYNEDNIKDSKNDYGVSAKYGNFICYDFARTDATDDVCFKSVNSNLTISTKVLYPSTGRIATMYMAGIIDDENKTLVFRTDHYFPLYWGQKPTFDSRDESRGVGVDNENISLYNTNTALYFPLNCLISNSGQIYNSGQYIVNREDSSKFLYYTLRMDCAPCYIPNYDEKKYKTVFDLEESMRGKIISLSNGSGSIPELQNNKQDIEILQNLGTVKKEIMYVSRTKGLVLNSPKIENKLSMFFDKENVDILTINKGYNISIGRLNDILTSSKYKNSITFNEGYNENNQWNRNVVVDTDNFILKTKDGEINIGEKLKQLTTTQKE